MKKAASYLCNAAVILAASRLGLSVGSEDWAETILKTKSLPPVISLGFLIYTANKAVEIVNLSGKGEDGDKMAYDILREFKCV